MALDLKPLIVQSDSSLLLDVHSPGFEEARANIALFSELVKSPEHMHTYRISSLSLWNAASAGIGAHRIQDILEEFSRYPVPENILFNIKETIACYGKLRLLPTDDKGKLFLEIGEEKIREERKLENVYREPGEFLYRKKDYSLNQLHYYPYRPGQLLPE